MRTLIVCLVFALGLSVQPSSAQEPKGFDTFVQKLSDDETYGGAFIKLDAEDESTELYVEGMNSIDVYLSEEGDVPLAFREKLIKELKALKDGGGYEKLLQTKQDDVDVHFYLKESDGFVELFMFLIDEEDREVVLYKLSGNLSDSELKELMNSIKVN